MVARLRVPPGTCPGLPCYSFLYRNLQPLPPAASRTATVNLRQSEVFPKPINATISQVLGLAVLQVFLRDAALR